ncbi:Uncharacterized protein EbC_36500 [Erwinia billingiae Eb661]|uniref:Uncharacterized protein n=1 Tax=Erwinia billingiae (strain Eb661) TaxID=634500 RepID=D8MWH4_ERWBE|nr:Uncharacterized protein EbC_36500 [Erwinia billingiae Eb661]
MSHNFHAQAYPANPFHHSPIICQIVLPCLLAVLASRQSFVLPQP